jgi:hypothetical protein
MLSLFNPSSFPNQRIQAPFPADQPLSISLNWPLSAQTPSQKSFFNRALFHQEIIHKAPRIVNDDIWTFNTQVSSQWDGLRHFGYQKECVFYNGVTLEDIHGSGFEKGVTTEDGGTTRNGIQGLCTLFWACLVRES